MLGIFLYFARGEMKSPPSRTFYLTDSVPWATSSLPRGANTHGSAPAFHGYQDSVASSGRGSMLDAREAGEQYGSSARGLDDSSYGTLEERHNKRSGSKDSLLDQNYSKYFCTVIYREGEIICFSVNVKQIFEMLNVGFYLPFSKFNIASLC